ncbi:hypothetical protein GCM10009425_29310 [Pseudomonas asuensis]|uniref:Formyl transferase N-terminal domain-containing protein n=2 Tax=Pseudomonas asuensis TaxID=1825787 RepID=A0ABQ2GX68_9PSED|nr:hypothetical protein GCM10009425_29310 [Pseudomonas asuensis]
MKYKMVFLGSNAAVLDYFCCNSNFEVVGIICEEQLLNDDVITCAFLRDVPLRVAASYSEIEAALADFDSLDFCVICYFSRIIKSDLLEKFTFFNIHASYLPTYKGKHPVFHAIAAGEKEIGISLHKVTSSIDEGAIISREKAQFYYWMNEKDLMQALFAKTPVLMSDLVRYLKGELEPIPNSEGSYFPPFQPASIILHEDMTASDILNISRSQECYAGVRLQFRAQWFRIRKITVSRMDTLDNYEASGRILLKEQRPVGLQIDQAYYLKFSDVTAE